MKNIPQIIFVVASFAIITSYKDLAMFSGIDKMLLSIMLGALGAVVGTLAYQIVSKKTDLVKYLTLAGLCIVLLCGAVLLPKNKPKPTLEDSLTALINTNIEANTKEILSRPIDTNALKPPKLTPEQNAKLITCEICGYKAVAPDSDYCYNCYNSVFDPKYDGVKKDWVRNNQLYWFVPDKENTTVKFFEPKVEDSFKKDPTWKPSVTEKEVLKFNKEK